MLSIVPYQCILVIVVVAVVAVRHVVAVVGRVVAVEAAFEQNDLVVLGVS